MADQKRIQQLDFNLLKVFESLYLEQNMTRTAEQLHITPSAVSHAVKRLRECLQDPLFERSSNRMLPTAACQRMAPLIIDNLSRLRQILQQWGEFEPSTSTHHFRIALHDALEPSILPRLADVLHQQAPQVTFASVKVERGQLTRELASGHVDVAFDVALPIKPPVLHRKLIDESFCILLNAKHQLNDNLNSTRYFNARHISVSNRASGAAIEDLMLQEQGLARKIAIRCQNFYAAKEILKGSDLLLTLPTRLAMRLCDAQLRILPLPFDFPSVSTHLYWHRNTEQDAALQWFRDRLFALMTKT